MSYVEINAEIRMDRGKGVARKLRRAGRIPGVLYSATQESTSLTINPDDLELLRRQPLGWNTPIELVVDGLAGRRLVMLREMQRHPVSRSLLHVDLYVIEADTPVEVWVRLEPMGKAKGVEEGGRVNMMRRKIIVRCLAADIPAQIEVDVTPLDVGDKLFVDGIALPEGVEALYEQRFPVLVVSTKGAAVEEEEVEEVEEGEEGAEAGGEDATPADE